MTKADVPRARPRRVVGGLILLAVAMAGCSGGEYGSVSSSEKAPPDVVQATKSKKGPPAPRVPRGPDQAKALQDAKSK